MKKCAIELADGERIVAVVPESRRAVGWSNPVVWVFVAGPNDAIRRECIQMYTPSPPPTLVTLFRAGEEMCNVLISAVPTKRIKGKT